MPRYDAQCRSCGTVLPDTIFRGGWPDVPVVHLEASDDGLRRCGEFGILWTRPPSTGLPCHPSEDCVIHVHPPTGSIRYPGRTDVPMPAYSKRDGYIEVHLRTVRDIDKFCKAHKVISYATNYDGKNSAQYDRDNGYV